MDDELKTSLNAIEAPRPDTRAREQALAAAMAAFDAAQAGAGAGAQERQEISHDVQGHGFGARLRSIASRWKRNWTMDLRIPLGATFAAILVVPMGMYFLNQTALTPSGPVFQQPAEIEKTEMAEVPVADREMAMTRSRDEMAMAERAPSAAPAPMPSTASGGAMQSYEQSGVRPQAVVSAPIGAGDTFAGFEEGGVKLVADAPVSTFSIDVDTASYAYVRRMLEMGTVPQRDAVRVEELINYFAYDYPAPEAEGAPFTPSISVTPSPWNEESRLVHIGIKGQSVDISEVPPANLVLLIDTSGSMDEADKLPLLKRAFALLVNEMGADDTISIVTYAGSAGVVLEPTSGSEKAEILNAIENLQPGGSTAGAAGIEAAYRLAEEAMIPGGTNRVLLATDGDFNVGISDPDALEGFIEAKRDEGVFLSVLGFGTGNYNDAVMQSLSQAGNGNAAYIDSFTEARKVLVEEMGGTLMTIAKDVKVQVEFNPQTVSEYRLIGYETRALNREDFNDDTVDAGDIGAGHTVTAIYEITPVGARGSVDPLRYSEENATPIVTGSVEEYGFLKLRYKEPGSDTSALIQTPIPVAGAYEAIADAPSDVRFATAVAAFGQKLRGSGPLRAMGWDDIRDLAQSGRGADETGRRAEFIGLIDIARSLQ